MKFCRLALLVLLLAACARTPDFSDVTVFRNGNVITLDANYNDLTGLADALQTAIREPLAVYASAASNGSNNVRVAIRQRVPGEARNAIAAVFGSLVNVNLMLPEVQKEISTSGRVVRVEEDESGQYEAAIRIVDLDSEDQRLLTEYLRKLGRKAVAD